VPIFRSGAFRSLLWLCGSPSIPYTLAISVLACSDFAATTEITQVWCVVAVPPVSFGSPKIRRFSHGIEVASVRAGCRQVIDVLAIVIEAAFRPDNGRTVVHCRSAKWMPAFSTPPCARSVSLLLPTSGWPTIHPKTDRASHRCVWT